MHALLLTLTLIDMGDRGMDESAHDQERVGRPSLPSPRPILSRKRREQHDPILALSRLGGKINILEDESACYDTLFLRYGFASSYPPAP